MPTGSMFINNYLKIFICGVKHTIVLQNKLEIFQRLLLQILVVLYGLVRKQGQFAIQKVVNLYLEKVKGALTFYQAYHHR